MKVKTKDRSVDVAVVRVCAKCSDLCSVVLLDTAGEELRRNNGYVPEFMPGDHCGDYVELEIDVDTGRILNWAEGGKADLARSLAKFLKEGK